MFKLSNVISRNYSNLSSSRNLINLKKAHSKFLQTSCIVFKSRKSKNKSKFSANKSKNSNDPMESQVATQSDGICPASNTDATTSEPCSSAKPNTEGVYSPYRNWNHTLFGETTNDGDCHYETGQPFTLMSYNILAQDLIEQHQNIYWDHNKAALPWDVRLENLVQEILTIRPQILCLQELQRDHIDQLVDRLKDLEFNHVFKKTGYRTDGCAVFYNKNLFNLMERHAVEFEQPGVEYLDRKNVALIVKLCLTAAPQACFLVSTTHLLYNPRRQDVRLAQVQVLLAELDRTSIAGYYENGKIRRFPIILTGDFNLPPYTAPYQLITRGSLFYHNLTKPTLEEDSAERTIGQRFLPPWLGITDQCQHFQGVSRLQNTELNQISPYNSSLDEQYEKENEQLARSYPHLFATGQLEHDLNLYSVYRHTAANGKNEASTFQNYWLTVDYIFYSKHFSPKINSICEGYLKLVSRYSLPTVDQCAQMGMVPNTQFGSDHLALAAKFFFQIPKN